MNTEKKTRNVENLTSSGTARMLVNPLRNTTKTLDAPQRSAEVAQSNAVSPAPNTMTTPEIFGNSFFALHLHMPEIEKSDKKKGRLRPILVPLYPNHTIPGLLARDTTGKNVLEVKNPISSVRSLNCGAILGLGQPIPTNTASYPVSRSF